MCGCAGVRVLHATCLPTAMGWERDMNIRLVVFNREEGVAEVVDTSVVLHFNARLADTHRVCSASNVALVHQSSLALGELSCHCVPDTSVVEDHQVALVPAVRVDVLWGDCRSHESVDLLPGLLQGDNLAVGSLQRPDTTAVHLKVVVAGNRVGPNQW